MLAQAIEQDLAALFPARVSETIKNAGCFRQIRTSLSRGCHDLHEKAHKKGAYVGYRVASQPDRVYVYFQKDVLRIDFRGSPSLETDFTKAGIPVKPLKNFQARAGWVTGVRLPYDAASAQIDLVARALIKALRDSQQ